MKRAKFVFLIVFLALILLLRFVYVFTNQPQFHDGERVVFDTTLFSEPRIGRQQAISAKTSGGVNVLIMLPRYPQFHYGDRLHITGTFQRKLIDKKRMLSFITNPTATSITRKGIFGSEYLFEIVLRLRKKVVAFVGETLPIPSSSLLIGMVLGVKTQMPKEFSDALGRAGVLHVIAASGMNVSLVAGFLLGVFGIFTRRQIAIAVSIAGIIVYAFLAGLEPSIIRATIMGVVTLMAQAIGRQSLSLYTLFLAGYGMLFFSPLLLYDAGFQLSFLATLGLLYIRPLFERIWGMKTFVKKTFLGEDFATSFAAQAATLPVLIAQFGSYSFVSLLTNGLVLWVVPIVMVVGGLGMIVGMFFSPLGRVLLYIAMPFLLYFEKIVEVLGGSDIGFKIDALPWSVIVGYYLLLLSVIIWSGKRTQ